MIRRDDLLDGRVNKDIFKTREKKDAWDLEAKIFYGVDFNFLFT